MNIWVDADACPRVVTDIILKAAHRRGVKALFVSNRPVNVADTDWSGSVLVEEGPDVADQYIADHAEPGDLVVTQDIPLAAQLVSQHIVAMSPHGKLFDKQNAGESLATRNLMTDLRDTGMVGGGPRPFDDKAKRKFSNTFDAALTKLLKS